MSSNELLTAFDAAIRLGAGSLIEPYGLAREGEIVQIGVRFTSESIRAYLERKRMAATTPIGRELAEPISLEKKTLGATIVDISHYPDRTEFRLSNGQRIVVADGEVIDPEFRS